MMAWLLTFLNNDDELNDLINHKDIDIIISAISGFSGLKTTFMAASSGKKILLANKESVVAGGDIILPIAKKTNGHDRTDMAMICPKCDGSGEVNVEGGKCEINN